jgi:hypothetical protein
MKVIYEGYITYEYCLLAYYLLDTFVIIYYYLINYSSYFNNCSFVMINK